MDDFNDILLGGDRTADMLLDVLRSPKMNRDRSGSRSRSFSFDGSTSLSSSSGLIFSEAGSANNSLLRKRIVVTIISRTLWPLFVLFCTIVQFMFVAHHRLYSLQKPALRFIRNRSRKLIHALSWSKKAISHMSMSNLVSHKSDDDEGEPDVGLHWFGKGNVSEKAIGPDSSEYFDPEKPSVIYVHGFQRGTTARKFRETFNWFKNDSEFGIDMNAADHWIQEGWNVGIFYWNQLADEEYPQDAEAKIWCATGGRTGMRYRCLQSGQPVFKSSLGGTPSVGVILAKELEKFFGCEGDETFSYRLVGHSMGSQLAVNATSILCSMKKTTNPKIRLPSRIALLDPFFSMGPKAYLGQSTIFKRVANCIKVLKGHNIIFEQYQTSLIGRRAVNLQSIVAYIELDPHNIPWYKLKSRHISAIYLYFLSYAENVQLKEVTFGSGKDNSTSDVSGSKNSRKTRRLSRLTEIGTFPGIAKANEEEMRSLMDAGFVWRQVNGTEFLRLGSL